MQKALPRKQCAKCPWKKGVNPHEIPNGYCAIKHKKLKSTIADEDRYKIGGSLRLMSCHEFDPGAEKPCVGWLHNQMGEGNNIALRIAVATKRIDSNVQIVGEQHATFEDTLPKECDE